MFRLFVLALAAIAEAAAQPGTLPLLTRAEQVRRLDAEQALAGYPVRIRGVITCDVPAPDFFVQDQSAGIFIEGDRTGAPPRPVLGDLVEIDGISGPGKFAPVIREQRLRVVGKGTLPKARLQAFSELADGRQDSQWTQVRGIVRCATIDRVSWREPTLAMTVAAGENQFRIRVPVDRERDFSSWIGREASIEGVCGSLFNAERQLTGILFYVPRLKFITLEPTAVEVPFAALLRFSPNQGAGHRVRVRGTVVYQQPGTALFLMRGGRGLRVLTRQQTSLQPGDIVEVLGFPAMGEAGPMLEDAAFSRLGHTSAPPPVPFDPTVPWERHDGALVTFDATLFERRQHSSGLTLLLERSGILVDATLPMDSSRQGAGIDPPFIARSAWRESAWSGRADCDAGARRRVPHRSAHCGGRCGSARSAVVECSPHPVAGRHPRGDPAGGLCLGGGAGTAGA